MEAQQERALAIALNEFDGMVGEDIGGKALEFLLFALLFQLRILGRISAASKPHEVVEPGARGVKFIRQPQVPFADEPRGVAMLL